MIDKGMDDYSMDGWMEGWMEEGWMDGWMYGMINKGMDDWLDGLMDGVLKKIKIRDYILYAKNNHEGGRKNIYPKKR